MGADATGRTSSPNDEWRTTSLMLDKFERMATEKIRELKMHYHQIQQFEKALDVDSLIVEKGNAKRMIDTMMDGFRQILAKRLTIPADQHEAFDARIEPIQRQTQAVVNAIMTLIEKPLPNSFSSDLSSPTVKKNMFDDCFAPDDERDIYGGIAARESTKASSSGGELEQQQVHNDDFKFKLERAREDAEATKKLAQDIDDLNQVMVDLATLVHTQHEMVDSIEEHIELASHNVQSGNQQLKKALANKNAQVPLAAAAVGATVAGGPVGIAAGSTVLGVIAGVGGAVAGLFGGRILKRQVKEAAEARTPTTNENTSS